MLQMEALGRHEGLMKTRTLMPFPRPLAWSLPPLPPLRDPTRSPWYLRGISAECSQLGKQHSSTRLFGLRLPMQSSLVLVLV